MTNENDNICGGYYCSEEHGHIDCVIPKWFDHWHEETNNQHFYYQPDNDRFGPFPTKLAAWKHCETNPYD